jgi:dolichyl-phosphate beta-glucosyltransferase
VTKRVTLVVPCYNEANRLEVQQFRHYFAQNAGVRFIFVDDGSRDKTMDVLNLTISGFEDQALVLQCRTNQGKAEAVRTGVVHALTNFHQDMVGYWDADLATPLTALRYFAGVLDERVSIQMVFGSRVKLLGRHVERSPVRHYLGRIFATAVSIVLRLPIYDSQCGAKLFRVSPEMRHAFAEPFISKWVFDVEILARYLNFYSNDPQYLAGVIYEYPLETWTDIGGSKVRPVAFLDILRIWRDYLR